MELTQRSTISAQPAGPRSRRVSAAALVAILTVVAVSEAFIIGTLLARSSTGPTSVAEHATTAAADPLLAPSMIEFRASEHATTAAADPLLAPSMIEFRAGEHEGGATP